MLAEVPGGVLVEDLCKKKRNKMNTEIKPHKVRNTDLHSCSSGLMENILSLDAAPSSERGNQLFKVPPLRVVLWE